MTRNHARLRNRHNLLAVVGLDGRYAVLHLNYAVFSVFWWLFFPWFCYLWWIILLFFCLVTDFIFCIH